MKFSYLVIVSLLAGCASTSKSSQNNASPEYSQCVGGDIDACFQYAQSQPTKEGKTTRSAIVSYQYACFMDHPEACSKIGAIYGVSVLSMSKEGQKAMLRKACDKDQASACVRLGDLSPRGEANSFYEKACDLNEGQGCASLASALRKNWRFTKGLDQSIALDKKACELENAAGCLAIGQAYLFGSGVEKNEKKARAYFDLSCNEKHGEGCEVLGKIYTSGIGVEKDLKTANHYYDLAEKHKQVSTSQTPQSAYLVFVDACNYGDVLGCFNAGWFIGQGLEIKRNITTAREFFERACDEGLSSACDKGDEVGKSRSSKKTTERE